MTALFQLLNKDLLVIGDGERIDLWRKRGLSPVDDRVLACVFYARRAGLVQHTVKRLGNESFSDEFVSRAFSTGLMVDCTYELFVPPEYRDIPLSELDTLLPQRPVHDDLGPVYVSPAVN